MNEVNMASLLHHMHRFSVEATTKFKSIQSQHGSKSPTKTHTILTILNYQILPTSNR